VASAGRQRFGQSSARRTKTGPNPTDRGKCGSKHHVITDAAGVPLAGHVTAANVNDVTHALPLLMDLPRVGGARGAPRWRPAQLVADKGYDCQPLRDLVKWLGIQPRLARR